MKIARFLADNVVFKSAELLSLVQRDIPDASLLKKYGADPSRFTEIGGVRVHFRDQGKKDGPTIMLLHGTNVSLHTWEDWVSELSDEFRLVTLDLPGHGLSGRLPGDDYQPENILAFLKQFVEKLGLTRFSIVGNSWGGYIAWRYALAHAENIERLVLIDSSGYPYADPLAWRLARQPGMFYIFRWV